MERDYYSVSSLNTWLRCPMQFYGRYHENIVIPPSGAQTFGRATHEGIAEGYRRKLAGEAPKVSELQDVFAEGMHDEETQWDDKDPGELIDYGVGMLQYYYDTVFQVTEPVLVEERFEIDILGHPFVGYIDLVDTLRTVRDLKTSSKTEKHNLDDHLQLNLYAYAYREITGELETGIQLDTIVKNKKPKITHETAQTRQPKHLERALTTVQNIIQCIESDIWYPRADGWWCTQKWCGYYDLCHKEWL